MRASEIFGLGLLFFGPLWVLFLTLASDASNDFYLAGDTACIELRVLNAASSQKSDLRA